MNADREQPVNADREQPRPWVLVGAGPMRDAVRAAWSSQPEIADIVRTRLAAPDGKRFGRRLLGLGVDATIAAVTAVARHPRSRFIASNPWIALPLIVCGREVATTGLYAERGTRSWRVLRRVIGARPVITTVQVESADWNAEGGRSSVVLYGTSFGATERTVSTEGRFRVFVGGTSDRDAALVDRLVAEALRRDDLELVVADGRRRPELRSDRVESPGWVDQDRFVQLIGTSDVVVLPLRAGQRAAGHMVTVAALESGVPVVTTPSVGMTGYVAPPMVTEITPAAAFLDEVLAVAKTGRALGAEPFRAHWQARHAPARNARAVLDALARLCTTDTLDR